MYDMRNVRNVRPKVADFQRSNVRHVRPPPNVRQLGDFAVSNVRHVRRSAKMARHPSLFP